MGKLDEIKELIQRNKRFERGQSVLINIHDLEWLVEQVEKIEYLKKKVD